MFTGIIEELGRVAQLPPAGKAGQLVVRAGRVLDGTHVGDSIAVNGVCLTVTSMADGSFSADVMPQTLRSSSLGDLKPGDAVNLERALPADGRFGGHIVSGHIDSTGTIRQKRQEQNATVIKIGAPQEVLAYVVEKGSIAVDGVSLTVSAAEASSFTVSIIPHTLGETTLGLKGPGALVNLECDVIGKYVGKLLGGGAFDTDGSSTGASSSSGSSISLEYLQENGF